MSRKTVSGTMLTLLLIGMLTLAFHIQPVEASGTIYIRADGSVESDTAPISSVDNVTYTFTDNIYDQIVVERDNIVVDGADYTLQGTGRRWDSKGIDLTGRSNVTIKNMKIKAFFYGIWVSGSSNNTIYGNNIANNYRGISLSASMENSIYNNNFMNNAIQADAMGANVWDDGYPSGGNYWSNYNGTDFYSGPQQDETGSDGVGDTSYRIDIGNRDHYPLMGMFSDFNATLEYHVQTVCNSSISDSHFNGTAICFNVTGENGTTGFCRTCVPRVLMNETYRVFVNGKEVPHTLLPCSNSSHSYLYFTYNHSTQEIVIVPKFHTWTSMLLILVLIAVAIAIYKRKQLKTPIQ